MNQDQILSLVRSLLKIVGGIIIAKGYTDQGTFEAIAGGVLALIGLVWSHRRHGNSTPTTPPKP